MLPLHLEAMGVFQNPMPCPIVADWIEERHTGGINAELLMYWLRVGEPMPILADDGYGSGYGDGSGDGYGDGYGSGYGSGSGDGDGSGSGSGDGSGDGYGDGSGDGDGSGSGSGDGSGDGYGDGSGDGSGYGYGSGSGSGDGDGDGDGKFKTLTKIEDFVPNINDPILARSRDQGCLFGLYQGHSGREVILKNARQVWSWQSNRLCLLDVSQTKSTPETVRLSRVCEEVTMLEACAVMLCSDEAAESLASIPFSTRS